MTAPGAGTAAATAPGRAAYEAMHRSRMDRDGTDADGFIPWERLDETWGNDVDGLRRGDMNAAVQAVLNDAFPGLRKRLGEVAAERDDYAKRLRAADASWAALAVERDRFREDLEGLRDHIENLALGLEMSARTTAPSKKSEIESGCASALRGLLRIDGESGEETRQRLDRERNTRAGLED